MKARKLLAIIAALAVMLVIFAACNRNGEGTVDPPAATATPQAQDPAPPDGGNDPVDEPTGSIWQERDHIVFTQFTDQPTSPYRDDYWQYSHFYSHLYDYFNVSIRYLQINDAIENLSLMLASRTFEDFVFPRNTDMLRAYIEAGALLELSELFTEHTPNIVERNSQFWPVLRSFSGDGGMWVFNTHQPNFTNGFATPWLEWIVRVDILEQQGWPNIFDENDFFDVLAQGLVDNPYTIQGFPVTAYAQPLAAWGYNGLLCSTYQFALGRNNHMFFNRGMLYDIQYGHFIDATAEHSYRNGLEFLNRLWRYDMYHRDAVTNGWDEFEEKMLQGRVLSSFFYTWPMEQWNTRLRVEFDLPYRYVPVPFMLTSHHEAGDRKIYFTNAPEIWTSAGITTNVQDLERTLAIMDWQASDEGMLLRGWGVEGVNFEVMEDGWRTPTQWQREIEEMPEGTERRQRGWTMSGTDMFGFYGGLDANGQHWQLGNCARWAVERMDPIVRNYLEVHGWSSFTDMYTNNPNFDYAIEATIAFRQAAPSWDEEWDRAWTRIESATHAFTLRLITAESEAAFDAIFNEMQERRDAYGLQTMLELWNPEFQEILESVGG